jgi:hypothetical protein
MSEHKGMTGGPGPFSGQGIDQWHEIGLNVMYNVASIVTAPIEVFLRPQFGSRYFPVPIYLLSGLMMVLLSTFFGIAGAVGSMIPFVHVSRPMGMFGFGTISQAFFIASFVHGIRVWRLMMHPEREEISTYEGPPLPFFRLIPKGRSFWFCRICLEPAFLFVLSIVLGSFFILQLSAVIFLQVSAFFLAMKQYVAWYRSWEYIRNLMDMRYSGPKVAKLADNSATEDELAQVHLATFPKNLPPDIREATVAHIARAFSFESAPEPAFTKNPEAGITKMKFLVWLLVAVAAFYFVRANVRQFIATQHVLNAATHKQSPFAKSQPLLPPKQPSAEVLVPRPPIPELPPDPVAAPLAIPEDEPPADPAAVVASGYISKGFSTHLLPRVGPALTDISGPWTVTIRRPSLSIIYRFDIKQSGLSLGGQSLKQVTTGQGNSFAFFPLSGKVRNGGTMFNLDEGPASQRVPARTSWCPMTTMTLVPTPTGTLAGRWSSEACHASGTILMVRG